MEKILCYRSFQVGENQRRCTSGTVGWKTDTAGLRSFRGKEIVSTRATGLFSFDYPQKEREVFSARWWGPWG